jgi:hypothetical protein
LRGSAAGRFSVSLSLSLSLFESLLSCGWVSVALVCSPNWSPGRGRVRALDHCTSPLVPWETAGREKRQKSEIKETKQKKKRDKKKRFQIASLLRCSVFNPKGNRLREKNLIVTGMFLGWRPPKFKIQRIHGRG